MDLRGMSSYLMFLCTSKYSLQPDPYEYDMATPNVNSSFIKYMREENELFYTTFPEARRAAEEKKRLKALILDYCKLYGTLPDHLASAIPVPLHFNYEAESPFSRVRSHSVSYFSH